MILYLLTVVMVVNFGCVLNILEHGVPVAEEPVGIVPWSLCVDALNRMKG
jgi:hypothetical protein